jgi:GNAT superfamily N-acetyltransferase
MPDATRDTTWTIAPWTGTADPAALVPGLEAIFFAAAARPYPPGPEREVFRERWLGRYLSHDAKHLFVALDPGGGVAGYLAGALDDPAKAPRFRDIAYFETWAHLTARFPAHLHINLAPQARNHGLGRRLVEAFCAHAAAHGAPGVHVVTAEAARNVRFYTRAGFTRQSTLPNDGKPLVFLARPLIAP